MDNEEYSIDSLKTGFFHLRTFIQDRLNEYIPEAKIQQTLWKSYFSDTEYNDVLFVDLIKKYKMNAMEYMTLVIAMAPVIHPELLEQLLRPEVQRNLNPGTIGGYVKEPSRTFIPTCRTVSFILDRNDQEFYAMLDKEHFFYKENILKINPVPEGVPVVDGAIYLTEEYYHLFTSGRFEPKHNENFPARKIDTQLRWEDLVIRNITREQIAELEGWIKHQKNIFSREELRRKIKRGYRALFYGASGTGKTMTATLLGNSFNMPVYRVDLSMVVSKYIGETEKNLEKIFNMAESRNWILFFDEAEALFGKRGSGGTANDRYANQEVAFLLQRIEDFDGILILASNKLFDIDEAFTRRFQSIIEFPEPNAEERFILWNKTFENTGFEFSADIDFKKLADSHALTGGMLVNVLRYCAIKVYEKGDNILRQEDLIAGLKKEYAKERKMWVETPLKTTVSRVQMNGKIN